jgi:hypothetical protein
MCVQRAQCTCTATYPPPSCGPARITVCSCYGTQAAAVSHVGSEAAALPDTTTCCLPGPLQASTRPAMKQGLVGGAQRWHPGAELHLQCCCVLPLQVPMCTVLAARRCRDAEGMHPHAHLLRWLQQHRQTLADTGSSRHPGATTAVLLTSSNALAAADSKCEPGWLRPVQAGQADPPAAAPLTWDQDGEKVCAECTGRRGQQLDATQCVSLECSTAVRPSGQQQHAARSNTACIGQSPPSPDSSAAQCTCERSSIHQVESTM